MSKTNSTGKRKATAVIWCSDDDIRIAAAKGELEVTDRFGRTGLHQLVIDRNLHLLMVAIKAGANCSPRDQNGWTPLHFAAQAHDVDLCRALLDNGAEIDAPDANGNTPLWRAIFESRGREQVLRVLIHAKANLDQKNLHGTSPRDLAKSIANFVIDLDLLAK